MYNHVLPNVQKTRNIQIWRCTNWRCTKSVNVQLRATECIKKSFSKPINMGSSFENLDARISNMKTVQYENGS